MGRASERLHTNRRGGERASEFSSQQPVGAAPASQPAAATRDDGVLARPAGGAGRDWRTSPQTVGTRQGPLDLAAWRVL